MKYKFTCYNHGLLSGRMKVKIKCYFVRIVIVKITCYDAFLELLIAFKLEIEMKGCCYRCNAIFRGV